VGRPHTLSAEGAEVIVITFERKDAQVADMVLRQLPENTSGIRNNSAERCQKFLKFLSTI